VDSSHAALRRRPPTSPPGLAQRARASRQIGSFASWANLASADALVKLAPTLAATALLWGIMKFAPLCGGTRLAPLTPLLLPAALVAIPVVFQVVLVATGTSRQQAADAGWVLQPKVRPPARGVRLWSDRNALCHAVYALRCLLRLPLRLR
jgi:hypothetical protein